jgi:hypothetical protein
MKSRKIHCLDRARFRIEGHEVDAMRLGDRNIGRFSVRNGCRLMDREIGWFGIGVMCGIFKRQKSPFL